MQLPQCNLYPRDDESSKSTPQQKEIDMSWIADKVETVKIIGVVDLFSDLAKSDGDFWCVFSDTAPYSYGDANRTLISPSVMLRHLADIEDDCHFDEEKLAEVKKALEDWRAEEMTNPVYIDVEN